MSLHVITMHNVQTQFTPFSESSSTESTFQEFTWDDVDLSSLHPSFLYTLGEELGDGTTAIVYKATHPIHGEVAVKKFRSQYSYNAKHEADMLRLVQGHPNFTQLFDFWQDKEASYIAMELLDGELLHLIESDDQMPLEEVYTACLDILSGLEHLHTKRLIHFDLKPENIGYKFDGDRRVFKIIDMGTAYSMDEVDTESFQDDVNSGEMILTTLQYRPIEAFNLGSDVHNDKTDVWSFGCILYEMWTGQQLFRCSDSNSPDENKEEIKLGLSVVESLPWQESNSHQNIIVMLLKKCLVKSVEVRMSSDELRFLHDYHCSAL